MYRPIAYYFFMKLSDYTKEYIKRGGLLSFAKKIGVNRDTLYRYRIGTKMPSRQTMRRIVEATGGLVQPNDFY